MELGIILVFMCISAVCRYFIFKKRDIKGWYAFIPGVNKYKLGMLVKSKKLAIANSIMHVLFWIYFCMCLSLEVWIISKYAVRVTNSFDTNKISSIQVNVPESIANIAIWSKYILIALAIITLVVWCMMMWKFTIQHKRNPWWIILWAVIPVIPYIYFASISDVVAIDGKRYSIKKVEIKE